MSPANRRPGGSAATRRVTPQDVDLMLKASAEVQSQVQSQATFWKNILAEHPLMKAAIIMAGVGGISETLHVLWLAVRFLCWQFR
jgi:hypothetical protein